MRLWLSLTLLLYIYQDVRVCVYERRFNVLALSTSMKVNKTKRHGITNTK